MMEPSPREAQCCHALTLFFKSNYEKLERAFGRFGNWEKSWWALPTDSRPDPEQTWRELEQSGIQLILRQSSLFPPLLKEIPRPPHALYIKGKIELLQRPCVALVGTRKTILASNIAQELAGELAQAGCCVVSGLALGIDGLAHKGALAEHGATIAVLGHGLDMIYPASHTSLAAKILAGEGTLISEYPPNTPSLPYRFLERNRIISGLSLGVIVVEAPAHSGSLVTARFALEQNRDVFVVPGPAQHPNFEGAHDLIRAGAQLVTKAHHILEALNLPFNRSTAESRKSASHAEETPEEARVMEILRAASDPLPIDKIAEVSELEIQTLHRTLTFLSLRDAIKETARGWTIS